MKERPNFEMGETHKFFNARFNREFENTTLDTFYPDSPIRCVDKFGDAGWVVGNHKGVEIEGNFGTTKSWHWVIRDRDKANVGIQDCNLRMNVKEFKKCYPAKKKV